jgi:dihydroflavonol-4-reductase|tara:strand:- start:134 stop:1201 length:1068 start_codon:yes stop_codon:yes gene_type:complete
MKYTINTKQKVLVTGATGFVAGWIIKQLVEAGVCVHAAVRDPDSEAKVTHLKQLSQKGPGSVVLFKADLTEAGSYNKAMKGCATVFHTASPFILKFNDAKKDLIEPALTGTENVLSSVNATTSVKRVVLTSSVVAIYGDTIECVSTPSGKFNEDNWNTTSSATHQPYSYSKTLAERTAWKIAKDQDRWTLVVINPALVIGPTLSGKSTSGTHDIVRQLGDGTMKAGAPPFTLGVVDVRDVADAHIRAAYIKKAVGRHLIFNEAQSLLGLANLLKEKYGAAYPLPSKELPKWLLWLVGPIVDKTFSRKVISLNMGQKWVGDNSKSIEKLGINYSSLKASAEGMFQQMIDQGEFHKK